jgi:hypothetical protein
MGLETGVDLVARGAEIDRGELRDTRFQEDLGME